MKWKNRRQSQNVEVDPSYGVEPTVGFLDWAEGNRRIEKMRADGKKILKETMAEARVRDKLKTHEQNGTIPTPTPKPQPASRKIERVSVVPGPWTSVDNLKKGKRKP